jgi:uncharacterized membrane protein (UPF0136 family)
MLVFMGIILVAYVTEVFYYFSRSIGEQEYEVPEPAVTRCLGSILVWSPLTYLLWSSKSLRWPTYFGAFVLQFAFETTTCLMTAFSIPTENQKKNVPFIIECIRSVVSLFLLLNAFVVLVTKQAEVSTDEERQSLLVKQANGSVNQDGNGTYGIITPEASGDDEEASPKDDDKDVKAQQAKRLEEKGGWIGYLKGFAIFLLYLYPKDDWKVMGCLVLRLVHMLQQHALNLLTPLQLGIITTKIQQSYDTQSGVMPWKVIELWMLYS